MTTLEKYNFIRKEAIKVNPDIVKLEFGCKIIAKLYDKEFKAIITSDQMLDYVYAVNSSGVIFSEDPILINKIIKILGRDIRLADILLLLEKSSIPMGDYSIDSNRLDFYKIESDEPEIEWCWYLLQDSLEYHLNNHPEVIECIYNLIK